MKAALIAALAFLMLVACASQVKSPGESIATTGAQHRYSTLDAPPQAECAISDDPEYGRQLQNPVRIGGSFYEGPGREMAYLRALRGPKGEGLTFKRVGAAVGDEGQMVDVYHVSYEGLSEPISLYLDVYHLDSPRVPVGFTCSEVVPLTGRRNH